MRSRLLVRVSDELAVERKTVSLVIEDTMGAIFTMCSLPKKGVVLHPKVRQLETGHAERTLLNILLEVSN